MEFMETRYFTSNKMFSSKLIFFICLFLFIEKLAGANHQQNFNQFDDHYLSDFLKRSGREEFVSFRYFSSPEFIQFFQNVYDNTRTGESLSNKQQLVESDLLKNRGKIFYQERSLRFGIPLPFIKIKKHRFLPNLFYEKSKLISLVVSNQLQSSAYLRQDSRIGLNSKYRYFDNSFDFSLYLKSVQEGVVERGADQLAQRQTLFTFEDIQQNKKENDFSFDFTFKKIVLNNEVVFTLADFDLSSSPRSINNIVIYRNYLWGVVQFSPLFDLYYRDNFKSEENIRIGLSIQYFSLTTSFKSSLYTSQFNISYAPSFLDLNLNYSLQKNNSKIDNLEAPLLHGVSLQYRFP